MVKPVLDYEIPDALKVYMSSGGGGGGSGGSGGGNSCSGLSKNDGNPKKDPTYCGYFKGKR